MRPIGKPMMNKKEAQATVDGVKRIGRGIKNYGKNVVGGAKIVGDEASKVFHSAAGTKNAGMYAPTPFNIVKRSVKSVLKSVKNK